MKKLLFVGYQLPYLLNDSNYSVGGYIHRIKLIIENLNKLDFEVKVITWELDKQKLRKYKYFNFIEAFNKSSGIKKLRWFYYRVPKLISCIKLNNPDIIIQGCAGLDTGIYSLISKFFKIPFIYLVTNDIDVDNRLKTRVGIFGRIFYKIGLRNSSAIICQNTYQYNKLKKAYPNKLIEIIKNPYNIPKVKNTVNDRIHISWIGTFHKQKNLEGLLDIVKRNSEINFKIIGKRGVSKDSSTSFALRALSKCSNVEFLGYLTKEKIYNVLSKSIFLLNTSHYEGLSNTFLESLSVGTPIISLKSNPNNMINKYDLGFMVNPNGVKDKISYYNNEFDYNDAESRFKNYLDKHHNPKVIAHKYIQIFNQITNQYI